MEQQQQGYPPVGSVWHRTETDGTVTRRFVTTQWNGPDSVSFRENSDPHSTSVSLDMWHKWVRGVPPARMVIDDDAARSWTPWFPPVGSVWERRDRESGGVERRVIVEPPSSSLALWVNFIDCDAAAAQDGIAFSSSVLPSGWARWAKDATRVSVPKPSPFAETNFAAAVEVNRELSRKLAKAERQLKLAEAERDKAVADRDATDKALAAACADHVHRVGALKIQRDAALKAECRLHHELGELRSKLDTSKAEKIRRHLCQAIGIIDGVEQKG